ncbi:ribonuclease inhibitor-like [Neoarius graeffei]|uniref:ribonuclease inhibitor-like n=1 Tax=Neoarius graeffei TaxID=443677 RepID=UPI00298BE644|nr:ribonuclease inhibitor-like [Neoarius graeffei]
MESCDLDTDNVTPPSEKRELQRKRSDSPEPSCVSMKSDRSMDRPPLEFKNRDSSPVHSVLQKAGDRREKIFITDTGLYDCGVSDEGCAALSSALRSNPSHLRELDLSYNTLGDSGVKRLCAGLENPHCKLEILGLWGCGVSDEGYAALSSALRSNPSHLRHLNLNYNKLGDSGVKRLCAGLENPHCKLEILRLWCLR